MTGEQWMLTAEALARATKRARIAEEKLEAIKTHRENFRHSSYIEWLRELDTLLEAEG